MELGGKIKLHIRFQGDTLEQEFIVMKNLPMTCIIGIDAIERHQFVINGKEKTIFRIKTNATFDPEAILVTLPEEISINPFEMIPCFVANTQEDKSVNSIVAVSKEMVNNLESRKVKKQLQTAVFTKAIECPQALEVVPMQVDAKRPNVHLLCMLNTSNRAIKIKPWQIIGEISNIELKKVPQVTTVDESEDSRDLKACNRIEDKEKLTVNSLAAVADISFADAPEEGRSQLNKLVNEFSDIFAANSYDIQKTTLIEHTIETDGTGPVRHRPYRTPFKLQEELKRHLNEMIKNGIIRESNSPWAAPVLLVKKPHTSETRIVTDYRSLNKITKHDSFPLPNVNAILDQLGNKKWFSTIDLASGFFQIPMENKSIEKTAFICELGLFEYLRTPMGLRNSPSTMNRLLLKIFKDLIGKSVLVYMDDLMVMSNSIDEHLKDLRQVFTIFRQANLRLKAKKCSFMSKRVVFLGHVITPEGRFPNPKNVEKLLNFKVPTTLKELQSFIGLCSYYRSYVKKFSDIAHPLIELTKKGETKKIQWSQEAQAAFDLLKKHLTTEPILAHPLFELEFILQTDASGHSLGAVLSQIQKGKEVAIAYASRHLNAAERKYASIEREALAIIFGIKTFKYYLLDNPFTIETDCRPLLWLESMKEKDAGRVARWGKLLSSMKYKIKYKEGKIHRNADFFSRIPIAAIIEQPQEESLIRRAQDTDIFCRNIIFYLENGELLNPENKFPEWMPHIELYCLNNNILCHEFHQTSQKRDRQVKLQVVLPWSLRKTVVEEYHDRANHFAFLKTFLNIQRRYYWPTMAKDIKEYCKACLTCAKSKKLHTAVRPLMRPIDIARAPFDVLALDFMGPFRPKSRQGNSYIMVSTCLFSKYVDCIALPEITALTTAKALIERIFYQHGAPRCILSDRGSQFTSKLFKHLLERLEIKQKLTTAWHPQCNGQTERANKTLCQIIRGYINDEHDNWEDLLEPIKFAYVNSINSSTNFSPYFLTHGRDPVMLIDQIMNAVNDKTYTPQAYASKVMENLNTAYKMVRANLVKERMHQKEQYDKRAKELKYVIGDKVLLDIRGVVPAEKCKKFLPKYEGPYRVLKVYENGTIEITAEGVTKHVNTKRIIPLFETMVWQDEDCPDIAPVPQGTEQFLTAPREQETLEGNESGEDRQLEGEQQVVEPLRDETQSGGKSNKNTTESQGHKNAKIDEPTSKTQGENKTPSKDSRYGLRNRGKLRKPGWLDEYNQLEEEG